MILYKEKSTMFDDLLDLHELDFTIDKRGEGDYLVQALPRRFGADSAFDSYERSVDLTQDLDSLSSEVDAYVSGLGNLEVKVMPLDRVSFIQTYREEALSSFGLNKELRLYGAHLSKKDESSRLKVLYADLQATNSGMQVHMYLLLRENDQEMLEVDLDQFSVLSFGLNTLRLALRKMHLEPKVAPEGYAYVTIESRILEVKMHSALPVRDEKYLDVVYDLSEKAYLYNHDVLGEMFSLVFGSTRTKRKTVIDLDLI